MQRVVKQKELVGLRHLTSREKAALSEFVARLREKYADEVVLVVLFGSKVRGDFDEESDLDVLVVVEGDDRWPYWRAITDLTSDLLLDYEVNMSALVFDEEHYQWLMEHRAPIYNSTTREGVLVWMKKRGESSSGYA
ncbi:MAG: nucleotidyltransferase domain-containing protein [Anaerolineales bacterium]|nr:nucleotidyltransferase domain-containing protein [Anaerolineales bacterium]